MAGTSVYYITCLVAVLLVVYYRPNFKARKALSKIPTHTVDDTEDGQLQGDEDYLIASGYKKYSKINEVFKIKDPTGKFRIILDRQKLEEIKNVSAQVFSFRAWIREQLHMRYTGFPDRAPWATKTLRHDVNKNLDQLVSGMVTNIEACFNNKLPSNIQNWDSVDIFPPLFLCIVKITSQNFLGSEFANDPEWLGVAMRLNSNARDATADISAYPTYTRLWASYFIGSIKRIKRDRALATRKLGPLFHQRMAARNDSSLKKSDDPLQWMLDNAGPTLSLAEFVDTMMRLMFASIGTMAASSTVALIDLISQPQYTAELTQEIHEVLNGREIHIEDLEKLCKLDSFLSESQRLTPVFKLINREVEHDHTFRDGLYIPAGIEVHCPSYEIATDPDVHASPMTFDPQRFLKLRQQNPGSGKRYQFGTVSAENLAFGIGTQACPGRFVAANAMKLIFAKLLMGWEVKWGNEGPVKRPEYIYRRSILVPPLTYRMLVKRKDGEDGCGPGVLQHV